MSEKGKKHNFKDTLNLPETEFPMRGNLVEREPERLKKWEAEKLYFQIQDARKSANCPKFILHDGPPFANGDAHMGTALNKLLKDFIVKSRSMAGFQAPFIPGWDCHGLPIEMKVIEDAAGLSPAEIRTRCAAFAQKFLDLQRGTFKRLGVLGDWENPYVTMDPAYEADIIRTFSKFIERGAVFKGLKPVYWSFGAMTALAENEIEYKDKVSTAVFVAFPLNDDSFGADTHLAIWTTTPWTLPSNQGIALNPTFDYVVDVFAHEDGRTKRLVIAEALIDSFKEKTGFAPTGTDAQKVKGNAFEGMAAQHPFLDRTSKILMGRNFVTAEAGTGAVHIAPGHGADDYAAGMQNGLEVLSPVDDGGHFTEEVGLDELVGQHVFKTNNRISEILDEAGFLLGKETYAHQYPHCWRSKTPIIFRSVEQFFINLEGIRGEALKEIDKVEWTPDWGKNRIYATVEARPDWCISRQRTWGVPLPVFITPEGEAQIDADLARKVADIVESEGTNVWFSWDDDTWADKMGLPKGTTRVRDTLDVWIDSGSSSAAVLDRHPELHSPADVYLEATDQHRGWFQSSLMMSMALRDEAPYKHVITHGFVVNPDGSKISKSGKPMDVIIFVNKYGGDIVRLWAATVDYKDSIPYDDKAWKGIANSYRGFRNLIRILLANIGDFDAEKDSVPNEELTLIDRWILERLHQVTSACRTAYDQYEFRKVFNELNQFVSNDLSALYIDMTKDRMYCDAPDSQRRRASQTAMHQVFESLTVLLAPILSYTADEAWEFHGKKASVHLETFPEPDPAFAGTKATETVEELLNMRGLIQVEIEKERKAKTIGSNVEASAEVVFEDKAGIGDLLDQQETLTEFFIISELNASLGKEASASVTKSTAEKCPRCWRFESSIGTNTSLPELCGRCADVLKNTGTAVS